MIDLKQYNNQLSSDATSGQKGVMEQACSFDLPNNKMENWRYSNIKALHENLFTPVASNSDVEKEDLPEKTTSWPRLVFVNGTLSPEHSDTLPTGVAIFEKIDGDTAGDNSPDTVLSDLTYALNAGGLNITIAEKTVVEGLEVLFIAIGGEEEALHLRNNINMEGGSSLAIHMQYYDRLGNTGWINASNHICISEGANLVHYSDITSPNSLFINVRDVVANNAGKYENHSLLMASPSARHEVEFATGGENSDTLLNGVFLGGEGETLDTLTQAKHLMPNNVSEQFYKGLVAKGGQISFQGRVFVEKDAQKTIANQSCKNIILERSAIANVKPELLIFADDVKCAHGTTVGELDENALFYLQQRGISPMEARTILVNAFLDEIIDKMPNEQIQNCFRQKVVNWMASHQV